jgi:hypothetical protein
MSGLPPTVRYLIACEEILADPANLNRITLVALVSTIRSLAEPPFPCRYPELCVFVQLTECRGPGECRVELAHADSGQVVFRTQTRHVAFPGDPLEVVGLTFRLRNCLFSEPGLYGIQFWYNDGLIAQHPLLVR